MMADRGIAAEDLKGIRTIHEHPGGRIMLRTTRVEARPLSGTNVRNRKLTRQAL